MRVKSVLFSILQTLPKVSGIVIIIFSVLGFFEPKSLIWAVPYVPYLLAFIMFGMGLTISPEDFKKVLQHPRDVFLGMLLQYSIMPLVAVGICHVFKLPPELAIGVILVGCAPGGTASNVMTFIGRGNVALSVSMTLASTIVSPLLTPVLIYVFAGNYVNMSVPAMMLSVVQMVIAPIILGVVLNKYCKNISKAATTVMPLCSVFVIALIAGAIVGKNAEHLMHAGLFLIGVVLLHNLLGMFVGWLVSRLVHLDYDKTTAVSIEVGMQNSGLAAGIAALHFATNPLAPLPAALFSVCHNVTGSVFAGLRRRGSLQRQLREDAK